MPDQNSTGDKVKFCCDKTPSCSKPHQGLFLKQYGPQMLFLLRVYHKVSSFLYFLLFKHMCSTVQGSRFFILSYEHSYSVVMPLKILGHRLLQQCNRHI